MNPAKKPRRWMVWLVQLAALGAVFYAGRYYAFRTVANSPGKLAEVMADYKAAGKKPGATPVAADDARAEFDKIFGLQDNDKQAVHDFIQGLNAAALKSLLASFRKRITDKDKDAVEEMLSRLTLLDPHAALEIAQSLPAPQDNSIEFVWNVLSDWTDHDPAAALAAALQLMQDNKIDSAALSAVLGEMAKRNPQAALAALSGLPDELRSDRLYQNIFESWADTDPPAAAAAALDVPAGSRNGIIREIIRAWTDKDPAAAYAWAKTLPPSPARNEAVSDSLLALGKKEPEAAANLALEGSGASGQSNGLVEIVANWAQTDLAAALSWADKNNLNVDDYLNIVSNAFYGVNNLDPATATSILAQITHLDFAANVAGAMAKNLASQNITVAMQWAQSLPVDASSARSDALSSVMDDWVSKDPAAAAAYAQNLTADPDFGNIVADIATTWGAADPQAALAWAQNLPSGDGKDKALSLTVEELAKVDPVAAWQAFMQTGPQLAGDNLVYAVNSIFESWSRAQPAQAAAALQDVPEGEALDEATMQVADYWIQKDPAAATQWVESLSPGSARDTAVEELAGNTVKTDPVTAFTMAASISNPDTRADELLQVADAWADKDHAAAVAAIQNALGNATNLNQRQQRALQFILSGKKSGASLPF